MAHLPNQCQWSGHAGLLVPSNVIGSSANKFGISSSSFNSCYASNCANGFGYCTQIAGASAYDQLAAFRNASLASSLGIGTASQCFFAGNTNITYNGSPYLAQLATCSYGVQARLVATMMANVTALGFVVGMPLVGRQKAVLLVPVSSHDARRIIMHY